MASPSTPPTAAGAGAGAERGLTIVIKLGTSSICDEKTFMPKLANLSLLVETVVRLRSLGHHVLLVSSGAVGVGLRRLGLPKRPKHLSQAQAVAAVGQGRLMALYDSLFSQFDVPIAQILLTRDNLAERAQYLNARHTLRELLHFNVVPIINENDSVCNAELRFGDNDTLSAITAGMVNADHLFLLTDVEALYTDNPRSNPDARPVRVVDDVQKLRQEEYPVTVTSPGSSLGTGGMVTKLIAAELATAVGCSVIISIGSKPDRILTIIDEIQKHKSGDPAAPFQPTMGTHFLAKPTPMVDRKWWILHGLATAGAIFIDSGAVRAITKEKSSLFAAGITRVEGSFNAQQSVQIMTVVEDTLPRGDKTQRVVEVAKGLVNYSSAEIQRIVGVKSSEIETLLGYRDSDYVIHRNNIAITQPPAGGVGAAETASASP
ncbi:Glutamate 5-kinase [Polyrhizophydium stewartii]|uniref:Glutamate 5-kinase n=1 Tax=Polyrhizophydium stewartii TaxID=2732419 RepID=A0ABR4N968_9FUNG